MHGKDNKLIETQYTNYHLLICKNRPMVQRQEPAETIDLDLIFLSRELVFQGPISKTKHRRSVFMAGTEYLVQQLNHATTYLSSACQHHAKITQSHTFPALMRLSTTAHTLLMSNTSGISSNNSENSAYWQINTSGLFSYTCLIQVRGCTVTR